MPSADSTVEARQPFYSDPWLQVWGGDCREVLRSIPDGSVHTVVTSPPYWGLRDYGTGSWEGGDPACEHSVGGQVQDKWEGAITTGQRPGVDASHCRKCGAVRVDSQIGLEASPDAYVEAMVGVFREVRRVLRHDGTLWLNLGDSYAGDKYAHKPFGEDRTADASTPPSKPSLDFSAGGIKPKDLVGIPWRVAFALQADGWYLRSDVIWSKPNPMPESVTDRPTKSHEYLFLLTKSPRYFFDSEAVRETEAPESATRYAYVADDGRINKSGAYREAFEGTDEHGLQERARTGMPKPRLDGRRNLRSVWTIATQPYPGAHFATFPSKLVEPCIKAGTSEAGVCGECGAPLVRVMERTEEERADFKGSTFDDGKTVERDGGDRTQPGPRYVTKQRGWRASCLHDDAVPAQAVVLDPFAGSGTVAMVANSLSRRAILIDLNPDYLLQAMKRNTAVPLGL